MLDLSTSMILQWAGLQGDQKESNCWIMEDDKHQMAALTPRIPAFCSWNPDLWFAMAESRFTIAVPKITSGLTKFHYLVQALDEDTALRVKDLIVNPPQDAYEAWKTRLLQSFKLTRRERASRILDYPDFGWRANQLVGGRWRWPVDERDFSLSASPAVENDPQGGQDVYATSVGGPGW